MTFRIVRAERHRPVAWKNGLGVTREIAVAPAGCGVGDRFDWRLSIATIERDCDFSAFPGYDRTIQVIDGAGMVLAVGGQAPRRLDRLFEPFLFSGDAAAHCTLIDGPIHDLNLMVERTGFAARTTIHRLAATPVAGNGEAGLAIVICLAGAATLEPAMGPSAQLERWDTAIVDDGTPAFALRAASGGATVAAMTLTPRR